MTIQEKTAARIYEILPHKKELEFGCEYKALGQTFIQLNGLRSTEKEMPQGFYLFDMFENDGVVTEIIGQPIRLADILLAIDEVRDDWDYKCDALQKYNLSKDNLLNQSSEFCEMILGLLGY
jgi:hypothetical protein